MVYVYTMDCDYFIRYTFFGLGSSSSSSLYYILEMLGMSSRLEIVFKVYAADSSQTEPISKRNLLIKV